jgi:hypothetical protein
VNRPKTLTRAFERYSKLKNKRVERGNRGANAFRTVRMDCNAITASKMNLHDLTVTTPEEIEVLSALIEDKAQSETQAKKEDRQHKSFFWIFVVFIVSILIGYMKW